MSEFHFLRPWWLLAILPAGLLVWRMWMAADRQRAWRTIISPHLLPHLITGSASHANRWPTMLLTACWLIGIVALAGPAWRKEPAPFADDQAVLTIVIKITPSMQTGDIQPSRLARSVQKIHDLLELRADAKTALVAYSGSAHQVMPLTTDAAIINSFAAELDPSVMPSVGDAAGSALRLADKIVQHSQQRGWILWIADSAEAEQLSELGKYQAEKRTPVTVLAAVVPGTEQSSLAAAAQALGAALVPLTPDDSDIQRLAGNTRFSTVSDNRGERWQDAGYWLTPLLAIGCLAWFRQGWVLRREGNP